MSKHKQKGKKEDLQGFDEEKEKETLKKLSEMEAMANLEEESPEIKQQNLFSTNLFQKAHEAQIKKNKKKKKANKPAEGLAGTEQDQKDQEEEDNADENEESRKEFDIQEKNGQDDDEEMEDQEFLRQVAAEHGELGIKPKTCCPGHESAPPQRRTQAIRGLKSEKVGKPGAKEEEKGGKFWNTFIMLALVAFTGFMLFSKYNQEKFQKMARYNRGETLEEDLYELLEIDSSASGPDIKKQFKKLAIAWHPDKNPGCGEPCNEKFDKIHRAYEILADPEKRKNYDENSGVFSPIKSKTVSLTTNNYKRLVEESNDIWIIQVYEDGSPTCIRIADLWDMVAKSYGGTIKFGRVNAMKQPDLLSKLPYHITFFPTILAVVPDNYPDIFTWSHYGLELALKKFIDHNIVNYVNPTNQGEFMKKWSGRPQESKSSVMRKPEIVYITNGDTTPIFFKYSAFQLHELYDFYQNTFGEANKIRKSLNRAKLDFVVSIDHLKDESRNEPYEREIYSFQMNRGTISDYFTKILEFTKFNTLPELDKHLYAEFCGGNEVNSEDDYNYDDEIKPSICILLLKNSTSPELQKHINEIQKYQKAKSKELELNIVHDKPLFDNYHQIRFGIVDLNRHRKFQNIIAEFTKKNDHSFPAALAFIHQNGKYFACDNSEDLVDFIQKVERDDSFLDAYYTSEILGPHHLNEYLLPKNENIFTNFYKNFKSSLKDLKVLSALVVIIIANIYVFKKTFGSAVVNGLMLYGILSLALSLFMTYQEMF